MLLCNKSQTELSSLFRSLPDALHPFSSFPEVGQFLTPLQTRALFRHIPSQWNSESAQGPPINIIQILQIPKFYGLNLLV